MDYYNDFQRIVRSDNIEQVIDRYHVRKGKDCTDSDTKRSLNEVRDVLDSLKACRRITYPALIQLFKYCASFTTLQLALFLHIIQGLPLISFATSEGISEQAAHQMWVRMCEKNPDLANLRKKRRNQNGRSQRILDQGMGKRPCASASPVLGMPHQAARLSR